MKTTMFKKVIVLALALVMTLSLAACGDSSKSDFDYIKKNGKFVVGITDFAPMDYQETADGPWIGFDADVARLFAEKVLGVEAEFVIIDWDNKVLELNNKSIDCVWNGMTLGEEVMAAMSCSDPYCNNAQIVIVKSADASKYNSIDAVKGLTFAVEAGSAGESEAKALGFKTVPVQAQSDTLLEVSAGTSDAAIIDSLMAAAMVGEGTAYSSLTYTVPLNSEEYGVGFRKDSDLTEKLNQFFKDYSADIKKIAEKYGVEAALIQK